MGLDMHLTARKSLYGEYKDGERFDTEEMKKVRDVFPEMFRAGHLDSIEVGFEVGYWRKSNQIHKWFVDNVQKGVDNCQGFYVSKEDLSKLLVLVDKVLASSKLVNDSVVGGYTYGEAGKKIPMLQDGKVMLNTEVAEKLLPVEQGFFFGGTHYDEWYYGDLEETKEIIERCLKLDDGWDFEYRASW